MTGKLVPLAIVTILGVQATFAHAPEPPETYATSEGKESVYVVIYPGQLHLKGPAPFERTGSISQSMFGSLGAIANFLSVGNLEGLLTLARNRPSLLSLLENTQLLGDSFAYEDTMREGLVDAIKRASYAVADVEPCRFGSTRSRMAGRLMNYSGADSVLFARGDYILTKNFRNLLLSMEVRYFNRDQKSGRTRRDNTWYLLYVSPSRGKLLRPWDAGEKEALISIAEETYQFKIEQFPDNECAYRKDRNRFLHALRGRDVILPEMAVNEGWSDQSFEEEVERAAAHVSRMIRDDILLPHPEKGAKEDRVEFYTLTEVDYLKKRKGWELWNTDGNAIFRDTGGQMYSLPPGIYDFE